MSKPECPAPTNIGGRLYFERHEIENYKRALLGLPLLERDPRVPIELVPAGRFAEELGRSRRTLGRRLAEKKTEPLETEAA